MEESRLELKRDLLALFSTAKDIALSPSEDFSVKAQSLTACGLIANALLSLTGEEEKIDKAVVADMAAELARNITSMKADIDECLAKLREARRSLRE